MKPPQTAVRPVTEVLHGTTIVDPYRWLEDGSSDEVRAWTEQQNAYTRSVLDTLPQRDYFARRLERAFAHTAVGNPVVRDNSLFFTRRSPGQNQPVLMVRDLRDGNERPVLDPNIADAGGLVSLDWWYPSPSGRYLAYGYSRDGDEWSTLYVLDLESEGHLSEAIPRTRHSSVAWKKDESGFYYTRYPDPGEVPGGEENYHSRVRYHVLGTDPAQDPVVFGDGRPMREMRQVQVSDDGRYLLVTCYEGWRRSEIFLRSEETPGSGFAAVVTDRDALFYGEMVGDSLYLLTNYLASTYRVVAVDPRHPGEEHWKVIIPASDVILEAFSVVGNKLVVTAMKDACSRLLVYELDGSLASEVPLPEPGTISKVQGKTGGEVGFFTFTSFTTPPSIYRLEVARVQAVPGLAGEDWEKPAGLRVRQVFYRSLDGTRVPMFILHREDLELDGRRPTVLTGYGGFNIARTPEFRAAVLPWLQAGGVYAQANLRGGSEYGEDWHRAGMLENKQNVFDDFLAAAQYLVDAGYTSCRHLGIAGGSNGGLLVGAAMTQRPAMFRAVACGVPLLDMLRYHRFLIGALWVSEYGSPDDPEHFRWLLAYSPYHRVVEGESYPATLLHTAGSDSRVDPMHARKMAALLQRASSSGLPVLLRTESQAGHGAGKPVTRIIQEQADIWAFLAWQLELAI
ncbi:MAG: prolyl oligopeptidase family serine peptidase [Bacillota bacterium]